MLLTLWYLVTQLTHDRPGIWTKICLTPKPLCHAASLSLNDPVKHPRLLPKLEGANHWGTSSYWPQREAAPEEVRSQAPTWCRTPSSLTHWVQASSGTQLPSSMTWCWGQKQPSEGWSPQELVLPSQCRGQPSSQWLYTRDGGHDIAADREGSHSHGSTPTRGKQAQLIQGGKPSDTLAGAEKASFQQFLFSPFSLELELLAGHMITQNKDYISQPPLQLSVVMWLISDQWTVRGSLETYSSLRESLLKDSYACPLSLFLSSLILPLGTWMR